MEQAYAQALYAAIERGTEPTKAVHALKQRLAREKRMQLAPRIALSFARFAARAGQKGRMQISVARQEDAREAFKASGAEEADVCVDESLIGGWRLEGGGRLVDASYKKHLLELYNRVIA